MLFGRCGGAWTEESKLLGGSDKAALTSLPPSLPLPPQPHLLPPAVYRRDREEPNLCFHGGRELRSPPFKIRKDIMWLLTLQLVSDTVWMFMWPTFWLMIGPFCTAPPTLKLDWQPQVRVLALLTSSHSIIQSHKTEGKCAVSLSAGAKCLLRLQPTSFSRI